MKKIPTMFERDQTQRGHPVKNVLKAECAWVVAGEGIATRKLDGMNVKVEGGRLYKRQKPRFGDYDEASYVLCDRDDPADKYLFEAFDYTEACLPKTAGFFDGIYEAVGPKIQGNPEKRPVHVLVSVHPANKSLIYLIGNRSFDCLREILNTHTWEGIVFHHDDGRMAKIKRRDFGLPWPIKG